MPGGVEETVEYDPDARAIRDDPFPTYRLLRDHAPAYRSEAHGFWAVSRFEDVDRMLRDSPRFSNEPGDASDPMLAAVGPGDLLNRDPPRHRDLRRVVQSRFSTRALQATEPHVRSLARTLLRQSCESGGDDFASRVAWPLPVAVMHHVLGLPGCDVAQTTTWVRELDAPDGRSAAATLAALVDYIETAAQTLAPPEGSVLHAVGSARADGRLEADEVRGLCTALVLAGTATVACLLANAMLTLDRHPEQKRRLLDGDVDAGRAVSELIRYESPVQTLPRRPRVDIRLHGREIPAGAQVLLLLGSANRDERRFERPDVLDLLRAPRRNAAFGSGIHFCIGAALARMEARIVLEELIAGVRDFELTGTPVRLPSADVRGLLHLPLRLVPR